ncbi:MAG TPA: ATP-binding protein [Polyangiaceae bacterium]|nr:ATP-binding protein [Polyangiaceae bacterium]
MTHSDLFAELSLPELALRVGALEHKLRAKEKTIRVLIQRIEDSSTEGHSAFWVLEQNIVLEKMVAKRTAEINAQKEQLGQALAQLRGTQAKLIQAQKLEAIGQLAAGIAHEVNTPTQYVSDNTTFAQKGVTGLIDALEAATAVVQAAKNGSIDPQLISAADAAISKAKVPYLIKQLPRALEQSREGLERIASIVRAMKEFSHPSGAEKQPINLREAIETTIAVARNEWKYVAEVELEMPADLPLVPVLRNEFNQVILNLIVNAAHAIGELNAGGSRGKGTIRIVGQLLREQVEIRISDTGAGIPESARARVFEPFFTTKEVGKGTGQGLAIAYSVIVDKHQGSIAFETEVNRGTTFVIGLPLVDPTAAPVASVAETP